MKKVVPAIVFFSLFFTPGAGAQTIAQRPVMLAGASVLSTAAGHGMFIAPYIGISAGRNEIHFAPLIQACSKAINGAKLVYSRNLTGAEPFMYDGKYYSGADWFQLNGYASLQHTSPLNFHARFIEEHCFGKNYESVNIRNLKIATTEASLGIEARVNITGSICLRSFIAFSGFYRHEFVPVAGLCRAGNTLELGTSLQFLIQ